MSFPRSHSVPAQKTDEYGIGFASDSDEEGGPEHNSMPNLSRNLSRNVLSSQSSMARTASPDGGDASGGGGCGGTNLHIFFIWVDPSDPCADRLVEWPLPERYQTHVRRWEERYQVRAPVYSGAQCLHMVRRVDEDGEADCGGLLQVYLELGRQGNWIKMVDIARVAIMYLLGGMYLDTDMDLGPRTFSCQEVQDEETCYLVHDADGALQNHFFRAPKRHAFMRHLLHVLKVNALIEPHVVQATGPCALTAALTCFSYSHINICLPPPRGQGVRPKGAKGAQSTAEWSGWSESAVKTHLPAASSGAAADGQETDVAPSHVHLVEDDQDIFGRREMEALIGRIRERLGQAGYGLHTPPTPVDAFDGEVPWYRTIPASNGQMHQGLAAPRHGPSQIFVYLPWAFYVIHWREDRSWAAHRSACDCFGIHNWDTTWAPHSLLSSSCYSSYRGYGYGYGSGKQSIAAMWTAGVGGGAWTGVQQVSGNEDEAREDHERQGGSQLDLLTPVAPSTRPPQPAQAWGGDGKDLLAVQAGGALWASGGGERVVGGSGGVHGAEGVWQLLQHAPAPPAAAGMHQELTQQQQPSSAQYQYDNFLIPAQDSQAATLLPRSSSFSRVPDIPDFIVEEEENGDVDEDGKEEESEGSDSDPDALTLSPFHLQMLLDATKDLSGSS